MAAADFPTMTTAEIRSAFLSFFEERGCKLFPSSSLVPDDPSLLLANAGMNQFKPYYQGKKTMHEIGATSCQKCVRTNDIDIIGSDGRHASFFEMLGNFSFGASPRSRPAPGRSSSPPRSSSCRSSGSTSRSSPRTTNLRHLARTGDRGEPHLAPRRRRQLLGGRSHGPLRPLLRDLLRPGRGRWLRQARTAPRAATATGSSSTGTSFSRSSTARRTARCRSCRIAISTPAWASSA